MDLTLAFLQCASFVAAAVALAFCRWTSQASILIGLTALIGLGMGFAEPGPRTLESVHTFAGYFGIDIEPSAVHFPTGSTTKPGWLWPLPFAAFAAVALIALRRVRPDTTPSDGLLLPLAFAWICSAVWVGMQLLAAPAALVQPYGADRFLWPAGLLLTMTLARSSTSFGRLFLLLCLGIVLQRLPIALFSKLASDLGLGTSLDVHTIVDAIHPLTKLQFTPRLTPGCADQQFWMIWAEHVFAYPAFYLLSFTGIAFAAYMIQKHDRMSD